MGKKRIIKKGGSGSESGTSRALQRIPKKKVAIGTLNILATFNNTIVTLCDAKGNSLISASSGTLGFKGSRKSTPFAAAKIGELLAEKAMLMGLKSVDAVVRGVGSGRESAIRAFIAKGVEIQSIKDKTPVPHNGPRARKPRRI